MEKDKGKKMFRGVPIFEREPAKKSSFWEDYGRILMVENAKKRSEQGEMIKTTNLIHLC